MLTKLFFCVRQKLSPFLFSTKAIFHSTPQKMHFNFERQKKCGEDRSSRDWNGTQSLSFLMVQGLFNLNLGLSVLFFVSKYHVIRYEKNDDVASLLYETFTAHTMKSVNKVSSYPTQAVEHQVFWPPHKLLFKVFFFTKQESLFKKSFT